MLTFYAHEGLVEDPYPTFPGRVIRATREQIGRGGMPTPRRYGIVMGWLDPTTMTPLTAAMTAFCMPSLRPARPTSRTGTDPRCWRRFLPNLGIAS